MLRCLSVLAALSALLPAQLPVGAFTAVPNEIVFPWPPGSGGQVRSLDGAFWSSTDIRSAIGIRGTTLARANAPAVTPIVTQIDVGAPAVDSVVLPGAGLPGPESRDALLVSVLGGAELRFACTDAAGGVVVLPVAHPGWQRASMMQSLPVGNAVHVAARSQGGTELLRTTYDRTQGMFTQQPSLALGETIRDLCVVDFDDDQLPDVAVLTDSALRVYDLGGTAIHTSLLAHPGGAVEPLPQPSRRGGLALLRRNAANAGWELVHILDGVVSPAEPVAVGVANFVLGGLSTGDMNGDGLFDVAIQDNANKVRLVRVDGSTPSHFAPPATEPLVTIVGPTAVQAAANLCDYDYDGVADLLVPFVATDGVYSVCLKVGLRSLFGPALTPDEILMESFYDRDEYDNYTFLLGLDVTNLTAFDSMTITYYSATESVNLGKTQFAEQFLQTYHAIEGFAPSMFDPSKIDFPALTFFLVQFKSTTNTQQKPIFMFGATVDNDESSYAASPYMQANMPPGSSPEDVKRNPPAGTGGGRKKIGLIYPQRGIPVHLL